MSDGGVRSEVGLHQGSALSPSLFAMVMEFSNRSYKCHC